MKLSARYLYLNRDGRWPDFQLDQIKLSEDGVIAPASLPAPIGALPDGLASMPPADGASGLTIGPGGDLYWTDPARAAVFRQNACDRTIEQVDCLGGQGTGLTQLRHPRGLLFHSGLSRLLVSDTGNARIVLLDLSTDQLTGVWGRGEGAFKDPRGLAVDSAGFIYVADRGHGLIKKFSPQGFEVASFESGRKSPRWQPTEIVVARDASENERIFAIDDTSRHLRILSTDGAILQNILLKTNGRPVGLAVEAGAAVYIGDGSQGVIQKYGMSREGIELLGNAHFLGPVAALAVGGDGTLIVLYRGPITVPDPGGDLTPTDPIDGFAPLRLSLDAGKMPVGRLHGGPFLDPTVQVESWHRLRAEGMPIPEGTRITLYVRRGAKPSNGTTPAPPWLPGKNDFPVADLPSAQTARPPAPLAADTWYKVAGGARECLFPGTPGEAIWIAAKLESNGDSAPSLAQLRLDFQYEALADRLPDCYFDDVPGRGLVSRLVGLFAGLFEDVSDAIDRLPGRFDPDAAPSGDLANLADLVGLKTVADMPQIRLRAAIAGVTSRAASRGTTQGLIDALLTELNVSAYVDEPIRQAAIWILPNDCGPGDAADGSRGVGSILGVTTALATGEPQGAVVGSTLTLDQSQLISDSEIGLPLFGEFAHRVTIRVRRPRGAGPDWLRSVGAVVDRELPSHVEALICPVEPLLKLGFQARLGVDAVLGGPVAPEPLDAVAQGLSPVLGGLPPATLGVSTLGHAPLSLGTFPPGFPPSPENQS